jgi:hypothetical protein
LAAPLSFFRTREQLHHDIRCILPSVCFRDGIAEQAFLKGQEPSCELGPRAREGYDGFPQASGLFIGRAGEPDDDIRGMERFAKCSRQHDFNRP